MTDRQQVAVEIDEWQAAQRRVAVLVADLGEEAMRVTVPACPGWSARELLAHMVGLGADVLAGNEPDAHDPAWTQAQVDSRSGRTPGDLLAEWRELAPRLCAWMRDHGTRPLNDVVIHEQDLRGAVGVPGGRRTEGLRRVRDRMAARVSGAIAGLPPLAMASTDEGPSQWVWSSDGAADGRDAAVLLRASGFDLARAVSGRRTADQLRSWTVQGDLSPYLPAFAGLGPLPQRPLPE